MAMLDEDYEALGVSGPLEYPDEWYASRYAMIRGFANFPTPYGPDADVPASFTWPAAYFEEVKTAKTLAFQLVQEYEQSRDEAEAYLIEQAMDDVEAFGRFDLTTYFDFTLACKTGISLLEEADLGGLSDFMATTSLEAAPSAAASKRHKGVKHKQQKDAREAVEDDVLRALAAAAFAGAGEPRRVRFHEPEDAIEFGFEGAGRW